jgi:hypothetical protein
MTLSGIAYRQEPSAPLTAVTGSLPLLPTPRASLNELRTTKRTPSQEDGTHGRYLASEVLNLLPTPTRHMVKDTGAPSEFDRKSPAITATVLRLLPTPDASVANYAEDPDEWQARADTLKEKHRNGNGHGTKPSTGLRLSPSFVEWMIGAPAGWSDPDCPLSATEFSARSAASPGSTSSASSEPA